MTEKTIYLAFDGAEFYDKKTCLEYEANTCLPSFEKGVFLLDAAFSILPFSMKHYKECKYIYISTEEVAAAFNKMLISEGYDAHPDGAGIFEWSYGFREWASLKEKRARMCAALCKVEETIAQIKKAVERKEEWEE